MASDPARHLQVVDTDTGEVVEDVQCPNCAHLAEQLAGAEKDIRAWRTRYAQLKRTREDEAENHDLFPAGLALFRLWQRLCERPRTEWTAERFELVLPFIERDGVERCRQAIRGASFDPFTKRRKNGTVKRFNDWELIFRSQKTLEDFADRAPEHAETIRRQTMLEVAFDVAGRVLERVRLIEQNEDPVAVAELLAEINGLLARWARGEA